MYLANVKKINFLAKRSGLMISISIYLKIYEIKQSEPTERLSKC